MKYVLKFFTIISIYDRWIYKIYMSRYMLQMAGCEISDTAKVMCFGKVIFTSS